MNEDFTERERVEQFRDIEIDRFRGACPASLGISTFARPLSDSMDWELSYRFTRVSRLLLRLKLITAAVLLGLRPACAAAADGMRHLEKSGAATRLMVDGQPLVLIVGELHNSSSSSLTYMQPIWPKLAALNLNRVIASLSWESVEPEEGKFDFTLLDIAKVGLATTLSCWVTWTSSPAATHHKICGHCSGAC